MTALSPTDAWAAGSTYVEANSAQSLIKRWDGSSWHRSAPPTPSGASHGNLSGVTADSAGGFWAVGTYRNVTGNSRTLIERCL